MLPGMEHLSHEERVDRLVLFSLEQVLDPQYGMYIWPCAVVLAQYVWFYRNTIRGKTILEIGAGASLPGIVAAKCAARVILSDGAETQNCLDNCRLNCQINNLEDVPVVGLTWGQISPDLVLLPQIDIVLGSDVFYEPKDFEDILITIFYLMQKNPHVLFWTTYQERSADWSIEALLHKWNLKCVHIPLKTFNANEQHLAGSSLPGRHTVHMMVITLRTSIPSATNS
ncbi:methyltransferase-like protein 23 isoform X2 [Scyliorhinus canicula]|uniref:methyltransferase-like protein 23 isoform X2 n=1 Tax=Scyliorhinus canicula TaxID=7830 RepID=UPI0018F303DD|nr:methyltransferase-like protein 23 isoform X2 [Scyliorhinus canicula]